MHHPRNRWLRCVELRLAQLSTSPCADLQRFAGVCQQFDPRTSADSIATSFQVSLKPYSAAREISCARRPSREGALASTSRVACSRNGATSCSPTVTMQFSTTGAPSCLVILQLSLTYRCRMEAMMSFSRHESITSPSEMAPAVTALPWAADCTITYCL